MKATSAEGTGRTVYVHGVPRKDTDRVWKGLQQVYGIGASLADRVCRQFARSRRTTLAERRDAGRLTPLERWLSDHVLFETELRRREEATILRYVRAGALRGIRLRQGRPVRGQRTSTNARTAKRLNRARVPVSS